jgi:hypothetical protein
MYIYICICIYIVYFCLRGDGALLGSVPGIFRKGQKDGQFNIDALSKALLVAATPTVQVFYISNKYIYIFVFNYNYIYMYIILN